MTDVDSAPAPVGEDTPGDPPRRRPLTPGRVGLAIYLVGLAIYLLLPWARSVYRYIRRNLGRIGLTVYLVVLLWYSLNRGIPMDRIGQTGWIVIGMLVAKIGQPLQAHVRTFLDWLPLLAALVLYDFTRGIADTLGMPLRVGELVDVERVMFGGAMPTTWLQERVYDVLSVRWWDLAAALVYFSHFVVPWTLAAVFYIWSRPRWVSYIRRVLLLSYAGLLTYVLLPSAPPWYAASAGFIDEPVYRLVGRGWNELGLRSADVWLANAQADANAVAALPSLHAAFSLLVVLTLWPLARHWALRVLLVLFPLGMAFTLVYGGEHYVLDVLLGWLYVAVVMVVASRWERWRERLPDPKLVEQQVGAV